MGVINSWSLNPTIDKRRAKDLLRQASLAISDCSDANGLIGALLRFEGHTAVAIDVLRLWTEADPGNAVAMT